jgi:riboflavin kinase/FMN adenylyltransferase
MKNISQKKNVKGTVFTGKVVRGADRGKELGFPTANLDTVGLDIGYGVYQAEVELEGKKYQALMHFGPKETFGEGPDLEIHIKKFDRDIYGQRLAVRVIKKIRDIRKFDSAEELEAQIARDLKTDTRDLR